MVDRLTVKAVLDRHADRILQLGAMAMTDAQFEVFRKAVLDELGWKGAAGSLVEVLGGGALDSGRKGMGRPYAGKKGGAP